MYVDCAALCGAAAADISGDCGGPWHCPGGPWTRLSHLPVHRIRHFIGLLLSGSFLLHKAHKFHYNTATKNFFFLTVRD